MSRTDFPINQSGFLYAAPIGPKTWEQEIVPLPKITPPTVDPADFFPNTVSQTVQLKEVIPVDVIRPFAELLKEQAVEIARLHRQVEKLQDELALAKCRPWEPLVKAGGNRLSLDLSTMPTAGDDE